MVYVDINANKLHNTDSDSTGYEKRKKITNCAL